MTKTLKIEGMMCGHCEARVNFPPMHHVRIDCKRNDGNPQFSERRGLSCHDPLLSVYGH